MAVQHIVIVDDAESNLEVLSAIVADIPQTLAHCFTSSFEALAWSNDNHVDAFLIDYHMPEPDGLAMIRLLRAKPQYKYAPIVVVTAAPEFEARLAALAAGANDFIERPVVREEVISRLRTLLSLEAERSGLVEHVDSLESSLRRAERRSRAQAERLATLWHVANAAGDEIIEETLQAVLDEGAAALRPGQTFFGSLTRIEGEYCVQVAAALPPEVLRVAPRVARPGERVPISETLLKLVIGSQTALSWDDVASEPALAGVGRVRELGLRAQISVPFTAGDAGYVLTFASLEPVAEPFTNDDHVYVKLLADFFAGRIRDTAQRQRLALQAERLATLWRVANASYNPDDGDSLQEVLNEGAAGIRPGHVFYGCLMRVQGDHCILLAAARPADISETVPASAPLGGSVPTNAMAERLALERRATLSWEDLTTDPHVAGLPRVRALGERAMIVTPFEVGRTTYLLSFASQSPAREPFGPEDHMYVNLLADFFTTRIQRAEHSDRLLHHLAHDTLTGLRNRTQFRLDARAHLAEHRAGTVGVVSLDGFRAINEEYGHIIGDALLVEVGAALERAVGSTGVAGRLAGDTFGVFLAGVGTAEEAHRRLSLLHEVFTRPFSTGDREGREFIPLSASIGGAVTNDASTRLDQLLSHADTAVLEAKRHGHGHLEMYRKGMESEASSRARTSKELSEALERREFELYFQPHLDVHSMSVTGAEALIRWNHPEHGVLLPGAFIPFAERHGLVRAITRWVMAQALDASQILREIDPAFRLYFNISGVDFADAAIVVELSAAARRGTSLASIGVELTETAAMRDLGAAARTVRALQDLGVRVAIDDFGTGYAGIALLKRLPVDVVKLDRSFIHEALHGKRDAAIAEAVIRGGANIGYETVGEGVETGAQMDWLRDAGCRYVQGFAIARPQPLHAFVEWLEKRTPPERVA